MVAPAPSPIACVVGRYALGPEIARGGLATVHVGLTLGEAGFARTVAVKRLLPGFARDPEFLAAFVDEAKLASRIRHPNVVPTLDVVSQDGELFVVMEYVHGDSLSGLMREARSRVARVPLGVVSAILASALHGLHAAHEAKDEHGAPLHLVHRDVSPHNVLVGTDGVARVLDFGIAKAVGRAGITREGQVKGKLAYMAPEQLAQRAERASDIYAAGVCLWEALTMQRLFASDNESAVLAKIMAGVVAPPSKHAPDLPPDLDAITLRALRRNPGERFATAREMARALESAVPPAPAAEVGDWVEGLAASNLARRSAHIAELETGSAALVLGPPAPAQPSPEHPPVPAAPPAPPAVASRDVAPAAASAVSASAVAGTTSLDASAAGPRPRRRRAWVMWSGAGVVLAAVVLLANVLRGGRVHAGEDAPRTGSESAATAGPTEPQAVPPARADTAERAAAPPPATGSAAPEPAPESTSGPSSIPAVARPRVRPAAAAAPRGNCDPPYSVGADGVRHYKKACLR